MKELVRLRMRPSRNGKAFTYLLDYVDENGKKRCKSLGHSDKKKAEKQKKNMELELRAGVVRPRSMKLSAFFNDSLDRTGQQIRESTHSDYRSAMEQFVKVVGDIDYQKVTLAHGELFRQAQLDKGNAPATVSKKVRALKRFFELAVRRRQMDENVLKYLDQPKWGKSSVEVYKTDECERLINVAHKNCGSIAWDLLIYTALCTGMRRAELLNLVWADVDFDAQEIHVTPKQDTAETWRWLIKDTDSRDLPLTDDLVAMLAEHQAAQPDRYAYVFVPPQRYEEIQKLRKQGRWTLSDARLKVINNFRREFQKLQRQASVRLHLRFHDLRNTALTNWFRNGMSEHDVMRLAGHASFETTHRFYLAVADDLVDRARAAADAGLGQKLRRICGAPTFSGK